MAGGSVPRGATMIRLLVLLLWLPLMARADLPAPISDTVSDYAGLLDPATEARLSDRLRAARQETGVQIALVTLNHIAAFGGAGQSIETYAETLFNHWGIGDAGRNDGILILVAVQDRAIRIALGAGFDPGFNTVAAQVIDSEILPAFREDQYATGITRGVEATIADLARPFANHSPPKTPFDVSGFLLGALVLLVFMLFKAKSLLGLAFLRFRSCPSCGQRGLQSQTEEIMPALANGFGQARRTITCPSCGYHSTEIYSISNSYRDDSGSGGSSGFGGGSSSGGGATGRW